MTTKWHERKSNLTVQRGIYDHRSPYERDHNRVIHCEAFRLLQGKKQVFSYPGKDFHRTRLTHSLEVASIARSISRNLSFRFPYYRTVLPNDDLISAISLLHDIGHPPFGHAGERALNSIMLNHGGYESNAQTLRMISKLDKSYGDFGLDLTRRTLLGILKYPCSYTTLQAITDEPNRQVIETSPPKCHYDEDQDVIDWLFDGLTSDQIACFQSYVLPSRNAHGRSLFSTIDCQIMTLADDIAYAVHDIEDAVHYRLLSHEDFLREELVTLFASSALPFSLSDMVKSLLSRNKRTQKRMLGNIINELITSTGLEEDKDKIKLEDPIFRLSLRLPDSNLSFLQILKDILHDRVFNSAEIQAQNALGQDTIHKLFNQMKEGKDSGKEQNSVQRVICDTISMLSDASASSLSK